MNEVRKKLNPRYATLDFLDDSANFATILGYASIVGGILFLGTTAFLFYSLPFEELGQKFGLLNSMYYFTILAMLVYISSLLWLGYSFIQFSNLVKKAIKSKRASLLAEAFSHLRIAYICIIIVTLLSIFNKAY